MNVGPTSDGTIAPIFEERLLQMGAWLKYNGEAIYGTDVWTSQNDTITPNIWCAAFLGFCTVFLNNDFPGILLKQRTAPQRCMQ